MPIERSVERRSQRSSWIKLAAWSSALALAFVLFPFLLSLVLHVLGVEVRHCFDYCDSTNSNGVDLLEWALGSFVFAATMALIAAAAWIAHFVELLRRRRRGQEPA
jgi:hypothetical protein